ncbi:zinc-dependent peptidase [Chryseobacterium binzhouense]|jgi:MtfA peptidase|uniref:zinc-dependent peptidase n=1 Tax=Chryseobacterium binzhouense TaxID=2593646 RepID=UPI0028A226E5|nr:zinc-dependent peptidase [Chryseobacterium binzhouense]
MKKFFSSVYGAIIVVSLYVAFWYWYLKSVVMALFPIVLISSFYGIDFVIKSIARNPTFIHYHFFPKKLPLQQRKIILENFSFYKRLHPKFQTSFDHRVVCFLNKYKLIEREGFQLSEERKIMIAACYVQLTFGMYSYLIDSFRNILIYPDFYYSPITGKHHYGEYNPKMKIVVLSWNKFYEGIQFESSNYNLGIHEFSHAILGSFKYKRKNRQSIAENDFNLGCRKILALWSDSGKRNLIIDSDYFRTYAFTNLGEFTSVVLEHFFETPEDFKAKFPDLFVIVKKMINYREDWFQY